MTVLIYDIYTISIIKSVCAFIKNKNIIHVHSLYIVHINTNHYGYASCIHITLNYSHSTNHNLSGQN